jgi:glycosyltransferase involved in cell wall biosynthesis
MKSPVNSFVIISPGFPLNEQDTTCLPAIQQFVLACKDERPEMKIIIIAMQYPFTNSQYQWHGVEVFAIGGRNRGGIRRVGTWLRTYRCLNRVVTGNCKGMLSLWLHESAFVGKWFSKMRGIRHYTWLQGQDAKKNNSYVKMISPKADELIAISEYNSGELTRNHQIRPSHIIRNGISPSIYPPLNTGTRRISILGAGSLIPLKRWNLFIDIISELRNDFPDILCVLVGDGPERSVLQKQISQKDLSKNVKRIPAGRVAPRSCAQINE